MRKITIISFLILIFAAIMVAKKINHEDHVTFDQNIDEHIKVIENDLWRLDYTTVNSYIPVIMDNDSITSVSVFDSADEKVFFLEKGVLSTLEKILVEIDLLPFETIAKDIYYNDRKIGHVSLEYYHHDFFPYFYAIIISLCIFIFFEAFHRAISTSRELSVKKDELENSLVHLKNTQNRLAESKKQASLGKLVAGVGHELNTPLGVALTTVSYQEDKLDEFWTNYEQGILKKSSFEMFYKNLKEGLSLSRKNLLRAGKLIRDFQKIATKNYAEEIKVVNLNHHLDLVAVECDPVLRDTPHELSIEIEDTIEIETSALAISHVLQSLVSNSINHGFSSKTAGKITLSIEERVNNVFITYKDDGMGMKPDVLKRLYDPFFTTDMGGDGTGLGMHIVHNIVTNTLGGSISCKSELGEGTEFSISLPLVYNDFVG